MPLALRTKCAQQRRRLAISLSLASSFVNADIGACGFTADSEDVSIDLILAAEEGWNGVINADVQYRLLLPEYGAQFKYFNGTEPGANGKRSSPAGTRLAVAAITSTTGDDIVGVRFIVSRTDLARLGWSGGPLQFQLATQSGVPGEPNEGIPDETIVFTGVP